MLRSLCVAGGLALAACAAESGLPPLDDSMDDPFDEQSESEALAQFAESLTPIWRRDLSRLDDDVAVLERCFAEHERDATQDACIPAVDRACAVEQGEDAAITTGGARQCYWRAIAAWERVAGAVEDRLRLALTGRDLAAFQAAQSAWSLYLDANVRALSAPYDGGSIEGVVAGEARARTLARRALELLEFERRLAG
jgi:hypothetical protein